MQPMADLAPILTLITRARRRVAWGNFIQTIGSVAVWGGVALVAVSVAAKLAALWWPALGERGWWFLVLASSVVLAVLALTLVRRERTGGDVAVASLVDVRLNLSDRLSTAVAVAHRVDPFAQVAVEDALVVARDRRMTEALGRALPIRTPRNIWIGPALFVFACCVWWFVPGLSIGHAQPVADPFAATLQAAREAGKAQVDMLQAQIEAKPQLDKELGKGGEEKSASADLTDEKLATPDDVRRETTRKVNELSKRLDELLAGEKAQQLDAMKESLSRIEPSKSGPLKELGEALKRGDASAAKSALEELQKQVETGKMDAATREELSKQLKELAQQLKEAANANDALKRELEKAGLDGALAKNSEAAKAAIDRSKNLNDAQKKALKKAIDSQAKANESLSKIAKACDSMGSKCKQGQQSSKAAGEQSSEGGEFSDQKQDGSESASDSLSEMEMLNELMKDAEAARSQCQSACAGGSDPSMPGPSSMNSKGGVGVGGERTKEKTATGSKARKEKVQSTGGEVIARQLVDAPPVVGESRETLRQLSGEIGTGYEEGTEEDPVPANLREVHKHYFGDLKKKIDAKSGAGAPTDPSPAPASGNATEPAKPPPQPAGAAASDPKKS